MVPDGTPSLNQIVRDRGGPEFLCVTDAELVGERAMDYDAGAFPDAVRDDRHVDPELREHGGVFDADHSGADDRHTLNQ